MPRKRTRSSKTTLENLIVIDEEVKERFDSIFKHQPMMPEKGFNLKSNYVKVVPMPIRKIINALKWERFCDARSLPDDELVREFYASLTTQDATKVIVQRKKVPLTSKSINDLFNLPDVEEDEYYPMMNNINWDLLQQVLNVVTNPGSQWIIRKYGSHSCRREYLKPVAKELNQGEQAEPSEPETKELTNAAETKSNSVAESEEEESETELVGPNLTEGTTNPEPGVELEKEPVKPSVEPEFVTPIPTHASTLKKSELSIMMDMCKFMHKQQQTYWKYAKIKDDSIRNTFKNISNTFVPKFPDDIFETWTEESDDASEDGA
ncbi:hypothetical protein J1N35_001555 [Gossypium stocksii]|uniref:Uncharacterized protein n=1 Tax=Gossypium stocksii TaxID=47602 RepID=A0A9D3WJ52_9ROSI|nr:hypothetical protein J1N35_001555 [Gossypium stocksii]